MPGVSWFNGASLMDVLVSGELSGDGAWFGVSPVFGGRAPRPSSAS
jgi:hypothetical protein